MCFLRSESIHNCIYSSSQIALLRLIWIFFVWPWEHSEYANQTDSLCTRFALSIILQPKSRKTFASKEFVCLCAELWVRFYFPPFSFAIFFFMYTKTNHQHTSIYCYTHAPSISTLSYPMVKLSPLWQLAICILRTTRPSTTMFISAFLSFFANYWSIKRILMRIIVFPLTM